MDPSKARITDNFEQFFMNHTFCVFVRIASARRFLQIPKTYVFLKNNMGISMKNTRSADLCADHIDFLTNFAKNNMGILMKNTRSADLCADRIDVLTNFAKYNMGILMKNTRSADLYADRIDLITNFAVITNVIIKRVHCIATRLLRFGLYDKI